MENGPPTIGLEDGAIDVERMLVEPQDEHLSMDSFMSFKRNIQENAMDMDDVSHSSGGSDTGIAPDGKDNINKEVLNAMPSEVGYFRLDDGFSNMGEEYLLGVEFAESITNLDYGSSEGLQTSISDSQVQVSSAGSDTACKSDHFRTGDVQNCQNSQFNGQSTNFSDISRECKMLVGKNFSFTPGSCISQNIRKLHNSSRFFIENASFDESDSKFTPASEMLCRRTEKDDLYELTGQDGLSHISQGQQALATMSVKASCTDILPTQKRSRKPTQRYIDELVDPVPTYSKIRPEIFPTQKDKSLGAKDRKRCNMGPKTIKPLAEESSVIPESITILDYSSSEGLQTSVSDSQVQVSSAGSDTACKSDHLRTVDVQNCQNSQFNGQSTNLSDISRECIMLVGKNSSSTPGSCAPHNTSKLHNSSRFSFENVSSDENDSKFSPASEMLCSRAEKHDVYELTGRDGLSNISQGQKALATTSVKSSCTDILPTQKRSRKPTQRYINELVDPIPTYSKKGREFSSTRKDKSLGAKDRKRCNMGAKTIKSLPEESSVIAIQVPFASLGNKECQDSRAYDPVEGADSRNLMTKSKGKCVAPQNQNKADKCGTVVNLEKKDDYATIQKKRELSNDYATIQKRIGKRDDYAIQNKKEKGDDNAAIQTAMDGCGAEAQLKKRNGHSTAPRQKRNNCTNTALIRKKRDGHLSSMSQNKRDKYHKKVHHKKLEDCQTAESSEEVSGRRKHHRLWTIAEVRELIEGVSQYGVGRWSRIKKLFFATSAHRTSVDLKDKWRNLLKASGMQDQGNQQGEKRRNLAWRPLPKSILRRVCELATMYPYPKGQRPKILHSHRDSPDRSVDITLSDYRRILRSINAG